MACWDIDSSSIPIGWIQFSVGKEDPDVSVALTTTCHGCAKSAERDISVSNCIIVLQ